MSALFPNLLHPLLFAHRGASALAPENTFDAFELGLKLGAHVLEMDAHLTKDGEVVVFHDATLERTTNGHGLVCDKTLAELRDLDAGYHFTRGENTHPFRGQGCQIPRLEDVLRAFPTAGFNIELKDRIPSLVRPMLDILSRTGATNVLLAASDDTIMADLEAAKPGCALGLSFGQVVAVLKASYFSCTIREFRGRALQIPLRHGTLGLGLVPIATRRVIRAGHDRGMEVHLFTIDQADVAKQWLDRGADGIMSNDPGRLGSLFSRNQARSPQRSL